MSFSIHLTAAKMRFYGSVAAAAAGMLLLLRLGYLLSPALLRLILLILWLAAVTAAPPRLALSRWRWRLLLAALLALLYLVLDLGIAGYLAAPVSPRAPASAPALQGDAALLARQLSAGRRELLQAVRSAGHLLWPAPGTFLFGLLFAGVQLALWPRMQRLLLRRTGNGVLNRRAWQLRELPRRCGAWIRSESLRGLLLGAVWGGGTWLLGFAYPAAAALLMGMGSWTPFWGPLLAAGLTLFFAAGVRQLPLQAGGAAIVFAVAWLASHLLLAPRLEAARPRVPRGAQLLFALCGYALAGITGFF
ncbi:MAG TPA: hypothetical protein PKI62_16090, partial [bacterium]|nr:hypothetical protein [bacterium]